MESSEVLSLFHQRLREAGLKSTQQRDIIAGTFFELDRHISVEELLLESRKKLPRIGYATVYRTLKLLVEQGMADTRDFGDGQTRYDPQLDDDAHDHLICVDCRNIIEFDDEVILARLGQIAREQGFSISRRKLEIYGECLQGADCPRRKST